AEPQRQAEQETDIGRDAFAAFKAEPDRKQMAEEGAKRGIERRIAAEYKANHDDGNGAFKNVAGKGRRRQVFAPGPQHVGGADIAGADAAQIRPAGNAGQKHAKRYRVAEITEDQRDGIMEHW